MQEVQAMIRMCFALVLTCSAVLAQSPFSPIRETPSDQLVFHTRVAGFNARDLNGRTWDSADLRGRVTLVTIWSTGCLPCRAEQPALERFYEDRTRTQVLTFALDPDPRRVRHYMNSRGLTFPVIVDSALVDKLFPAEGGIPKTFIIDREGRRSEQFQTWTFGRILLEAQRLAQAR